MKHIVEYELPYKHIVRVGITANRRFYAVNRAKSLFDKGTLWEDTEQIPLIYDDFEEQDGPLEFKIVAELPDDAPWPEAGACVKQLRRDKAAHLAAKLLVEAYEKGKKQGGSIQWEDLDRAHEAALKAVKF